MAEDIAITINAIRIMKIIGILLTVICLHFSISSYSQTITLSVKNGSLEKIFKEIEKQTNYYRFAYRWEVLQKAKPVDVEVNKAPLKDVLDICFKDQPLLIYEILENTIIIKEKATAGVNSSGELPALDTKGKVTDEKGEAISRATVSVKGTTKLTTTNENGEFFLEDVKENAVLFISHISYETKQLKLEGRKDIIIQLSLNVSELKIVKLSTGFDVLKSNERVGSFAHIDSSLLNRSVSTDIMSRLIGVTSGLLSDESAGNPLNISIRGRSTILANTQPLIVVDNFPYSGNINNINPNDVESITVLKDAASASQWGALSGNGVIVITTRKGNYNQGTRINFNTSITIGEKPDQFYDQNFLNANDFINVETFLFGKGFYDPALNNSTTFSPVSPVVEILAKRRNGSITAADSATWLDALRTLDVRKDIDKYLYRNPVRQQYAISLSGGSTNANYYLSFGYNKDLSNVIGNQNERFTLNSAMSFMPVKNLEISGGMVYTQSLGKTNGLSSVSASGLYSSIYPYAQLADANGRPLSVIRTYRNSFVEHPPVEGLLDWKYYPLRERDLLDNTSKLIDNHLTINIKYTVLKGLNAELKYQYGKGASDVKQYRDPDSYVIRDLVNRYSFVVANQVIRRNIPAGGLLSNSYSSTYSHNARAQLTYKRSFGVHSISAIAGIDLQEVKSDGNSSQVFGYDKSAGTSRQVNFDSLYLTYPSNLRATIPGAPTITPYTLDRFRSFYGNASYTYNNRYTIYTSVRLDQSNLFGVNTNQKGVPLWSVGSKWDIDKENFYNVKWLSELKLRVSYGYNGNLNRNITALTVASYFNRTVIDPGLAFAGITSPGNPDLRWEKIGMINIGVDFKTSTERIEGSIEFFHKKGLDMIGSIAVPSSTGFNSFNGNFSNMVGSGFDLALNTLNIDKRKFKWTTAFLISRATDKITKIEGRLDKLVGYPVNLVLAYRWGGLDANGDPLGYLNNVLSKDYNAIISATSQNPTLKVFKGSSNPTFFGAMRNIITWNRFSASANIVFKAGYSFRRNSISYSTLYGGKGHNDFTKRWQKPGDEKITNIPAMVFTDYNFYAGRDGFYSNAEVLIEKGDYIKLQDMNVTYTLEKKGKKRVLFTSFQIYFYSNNLFMIWKANKHGLDPDHVSGSPDPRTYSLGIRAGL